MKNSCPRTKYDLIVFDANKFNYYNLWVRITWTLAIFSCYSHPSSIGETFYVHLVGPDNKVIISSPLKIMYRESDDFNQVISCYFILLPHIKKYLNVSEITNLSDLEGDYKPIVLYMGNYRVDSLKSE